MKTEIATTLQHMQHLSVPDSFDEDAADAQILLRIHQIYDLNLGAAPTNSALAYRTGTPRRRLQQTIAGVLIIASAFAVIISQRGQSQRPNRNLVLVAARETTILDADGNAISIELGAALREGSVIRVGKGGTATIGSLVLPPGTIAHVEDGSVVIDTPDTTTTTQSTANLTTTTVVGQPSPTSAPNGATPSTNPVPRSTTTNFSERPANSSTPQGVSTTSRPTADRTVTARLQISQDTLTVQWQWPSSDRVAGIIVLGHAPGSNPTYPIVVGSGTARLFSTQLRSTTATQIRWVGGARILVVAVDRNQEMLGQSVVLIAPLR